MVPAIAAGNRARASYPRAPQRAVPASAPKRRLAAAAEAEHEPALGSSDVDASTFFDCEARQPVGGVVRAGGFGRSCQRGWGGITKRRRPAAHSPAFRSPVQAN